MAIIANNIPSSGMSHIYPLEFSWQQPIFPPEGLLDLSSRDHTIMFSCPSRGIFNISLWKFNCYSQLTLWRIILILALECCFTFSL